MTTTARGLSVSATEGDDNESSPAGEAMQRYGAVVARVCMALVGDGAAAEEILERIARTAASNEGAAAGAEVGLPELLRLAVQACAVKLSQKPRTAPHGRELLAENARPTGSPTLARAQLARLKPTEREAVVLHVVGGLAPEDVARASGVDVATARGRIGRGLAQLFALRKEDGR